MSRIASSTSRVALASAMATSSMSYEVRKLGVDKIGLVADKKKGGAAAKTTS